MILAYGALEICPLLWPLALEREQIALYYKPDVRCSGCWLLRWLCYWPLLWLGLSFCFSLGLGYCYGLGLWLGFSGR